MLCIEIELNGEHYCRAGVPAGVVSAFVNRIDIPAEPGGASAPSTSLSVSGFHFHGPDPGNQTAVHWRDVVRDLQPGDEVRLRLVETNEPDAYTVTPMLPPLPEDEA
jgi:hypothetical protein